MLPEFSKSIRKKLRELCGIAHERELNFHLNQLAQQFDEWKNKKMDCWELSDRIHQFHNGIAREVYNTYNNKMDEIWLVSRAIMNGFLDQNEIPKEIQALTVELTNRLQKI